MTHLRGNNQRLEEYVEKPQKTFQTYALFVFISILEVFREIFVCFRTHLFVRAHLAKTLYTSTQEGRPEPVVDV